MSNRSVPSTVPCRIEPCSTYSLQCLNDDRIEDSHISLLRPYLEDSFFKLPPSTVANRDDRLWVADKILEHQGDQAKTRIITIQSWMGISWF